MNRNLSLVGVMAAVVLLTLGLMVGAAHAEPAPGDITIVTIPQEPPFPIDSDGDGVADWTDDFPFDPTEWNDADDDGTGDNADIDDDNDGVWDPFDTFPFDPAEWVDSDGDGEGNNADADDDGDGQSDMDEAMCGSDPLDAGSLSTDTDGDAVPDCSDLDDDDDGVADGSDAFPFDPAESEDTDSDGVGNNADGDDDNDGQSDADEIDCGSDPLSAADTASDSDGDGTPDCVDPDDDDDGVSDGPDAFPLDPTESVDTDADGVGNNADADDDGDGVADGDDAFPLDPGVWAEPEPVAEVGDEGVGAGDGGAMDGDGELDGTVSELELPMDGDEQFEEPTVTTVAPVEEGQADPVALDDVPAETPQAAAPEVAIFDAQPGDSPNEAILIGLGVLLALNVAGFAVLGTRLRRR